MKDKLEPNMYVRTNKGTIDKLDDKNIMTYQVALIGFGEKSIKASHNIIDLIEVGDYVNGSKVVNINYDLNYDEDIVESITIFDYSIEGNDILHNEEIKSIVTKEVFSSVEYRMETN